MQPSSRTILVFVLILLMGPAALAGPLTLDDIVALKGLGFSDEEVAVEVEREGIAFRFSREAVQKLREAGFSPASIAMLKSIATREPGEPEFSVGQVLAWVGEGREPVEILAEIDRRGGGLRASPVEQMKLVVAGTPREVVLAAVGKPLDRSSMEKLAGDGLSEEAWALLLRILGCRAENVSPADALALSRSGVPDHVVAALRQGREPGATRADRGTSRIQSALVELTVPTEPGRYSHPVKSFELVYPREWRLLRALHEAEVGYYVTPDSTVRDPVLLREGVSVFLMRAVRDSVLGRRDSVGILEYLLPGTERMEPGLRRDGEVEGTTLGTLGLPAARVRHVGKLSERVGEFALESYVARDGETVYYVVLVAPRGAKPEAWTKLRGVLADSRFGRPRPERPEATLEVRSIVEKYRESVVMVETPWGTGSGFFISADGYVLTNYHVMENKKEGGFYKVVNLHWDESMNRPPVKARLVHAVKRDSEVDSLVGLSGTDVALLKVDGGTYEPLPLTPTASVLPGDPVVALGFPGGRNFGGVSFSVTSGVVTRLNRISSGRVGSILTDAVIIGGNSGGPCISLVTGGVLGLNTFGYGVRFELQTGMAGASNFSGVIPVDDALRHYPQVTLGGLSWDAEGLDFLEAYALSREALNEEAFGAADKFAERARALRPDLPDAHAQVAEVLSTRAVSRYGRRPTTLAREIGKAIPLLTKVLETAPGHKRSRLLLATLYARIGQVEDAAAQVRQVIERDPRDWQGWLLLAQIGEAGLVPGTSIETAREAVEAAERAVAEGGDLRPEPHLVLGRLQYATKQFEEGRESFRRAVAMHPYQIEGYLGQAKYFHHLKRPDDALTAYRKVLERFPDNPVALKSIATINYQEKRYGEAHRIGMEAILAYYRAGDLAGTPPNLFLMVLESAITVRKPEDACLAGTLFLAFNDEHPEVIDVHLRLCDIHLPLNKNGLVGAHVRVARTLGKHKLLDTLSKEWDKQPMPIEDIKYALDTGYMWPVLGLLIRSGPLAFEVRTEKEAAALKKAHDLPDSIVAAIVAAYREHGAKKPAAGAGGAGGGNAGRGNAGGGNAGRGNAGGGNAGGGNAGGGNAGGGNAGGGNAGGGNAGGGGGGELDEMVHTIYGTWDGRGRDYQNTVFSETLTLEKDGRFTAIVRYPGREAIQIEGNFTAQRGILLLMSSDQNLFRFTYLMSKDSLTLREGGGQGYVKFTRRK